jgi:glycosyltransferase involved in cell wall biosynthesis
MPSVCYEVFPLVLLEALREGTPVVARALGPFPELVEKSRAGFLFDSEQELEQSIHRLATDRELRDRMGQAALDSYERYWSESRAMNDYFVLIKSIAKSRSMNDLANAILE